MTTKDSESSGGAVIQNVDKTERTDKPAIDTNDVPASSKNIKIKISFEDAVKLWSLTEEEKGDLLELQNRVSDIDHWKNDPFTLVRFLRARPKDVSAAETMFRNMIQWRLNNKIDTVLEDPQRQPSRELMDWFGGAYLKDYDKDGDPVFLKRTGIQDGNAFVNKFSQHDIVETWYNWNRELNTRGKWTEEYQQRQGRPIRLATMISDTEGMNWSHMNRKMIHIFKEISKKDQDYYPEYTKRIVVVRAPTMWNFVWSIAKHLLEPGVREKIVVARSSDYMKDLEKYVDPGVLPPCIYPQGRGEAATGFPPDFAEIKNNKS